MNLLVCLKQIPDLSAGISDAEVGLRFSEDAPQVVSTLDGYALEGAALLQDQDPSCAITLLSLDGESALRDDFSVVGEEAVLVRAPSVPQPDPVAKGMLLAAAVRELESRQGKPFDLILCGQQSADLGSGLCGPVLACQLGRPAVGNVLQAHWAQAGFRFQCQVEGGVQQVDVDTPCVALYTRSDHVLRYPTILRRMQASEMELPVLDAGALLQPDSSAYQYERRMRTIRVFAPRQKADAVRIRADIGETAALELLSLLERAKAL